MIACPGCGQAVKAPSLDALVLHLLNRPGGLSENAEAVLRAIWRGRGLRVALASMFDAINEHDPEGGHSLSFEYKQAREALAELGPALTGTGVAIVREGDGRRHVYRLRLMAHENAAPHNGRAA